MTAIPHAKAGREPVVALVGLGYVGLPLAVEFGKRFRTIAYDRSQDARRSPGGQTAPPSRAAEAKHEYGIERRAWDALPRVDALILAVAHGSFAERPGSEIAAKAVPGGCVADVKAALDLDELRRAGFACWRL